MGRLACGHPFASAPVSVDVNKASAAYAPAHGQFVLVVTHDCSAKTQIITSIGVTDIARFQGKQFAYALQLTKKHAALTIAVNGTPRDVTLVGEKGTYPTSPASAAA